MAANLATDVRTQSSSYQPLHYELPTAGSLQPENNLQQPWPAESLNTIPGALLTANVNFEELVPWIPPDTFVVLYATAEMPVRYAGIPLLSRELRFCSLEGGLRSWREAGLPLEQLILSDRKPVDNR